MAVIDTAELLLQAKNYSGSGDWLDESGNGHDASLVNSPTFNGDRFTLDADNESFDIVDSAGLNFDFGTLAGATVMVVCAPVDATPAGNQYIVDKSAAVGIGYRMILLTSSAFRGEFEDASGGRPDDFAAAFSDGVKVALAVRHDAAADETESFVDGAGTGTPNVFDLADCTSTEILRIGGRSDATTFAFRGDIYAVALWREALTDAEIVEAQAELESSGGNLLLLGVG